MISKRITLYDIKEHPLVDEIGWPPVGASEDILKTILHDLGIRVDLGFKQLTELVRNPEKPSETNDCLVFCGEERNDESWVKSGYASDEMVELQRGNMARSIRQSDIGDYR